MQWLGFLIKFTTCKNITCDICRWVGTVCLLRFVDWYCLSNNLTNIAEITLIFFLLQRSSYKSYIHFSPSSPFYMYQNLFVKYSVISYSYDTCLALVSFGKKTYNIYKYLLMYTTFNLRTYFIYMYSIKPCQIAVSQYQLLYTYHENSKTN